MNQLVIFAIVVGVLVFVIGLMDAGGKKKSKYNYKRKDFFMTRAEHECYDALVAAVGEKYYIFPQAKLTSIIDNKVKGQNWNGAFRHVSQKSVDFVLCDKAYISPKLAIELDDKTHLLPVRQDRDTEVERILKDASLPLLRLKNSGGFNINEIKEEINKILI
jgi:very-short-patch-repair endonuclease